MALINDNKLFLDSKQSNFKFEPSFVGIHQLLRVIWLFEHEFQARNFGQLRIFLGYQICQRTVYKLVNSIRISN